MRRYHRSGSGPCLLLSLVSALIGSYVLLRAISRAAQNAVRLEPPRNNNNRKIHEPQPPGGTVLVKPESECVVPLTVEVNDAVNYYIFLKFLKLPSDTASTPGLADAPWSDIGFFASANERVSLKVPGGVYSLMYASGMEWRGLKEKFGPGTNYYKANQTLTFYKEGNHLYGNTVQLFPQSEGDTAYRQIDASEFPG